MIAEDIAETVRLQLIEHPMVLSFDFLPSGVYRIGTSFLYPDGDMVDLFLTDLSYGEETLPLRISDLGETLAWLRMAGYVSRHDLDSGQMLKRQQELLSDILLLYVAQGFRSYRNEMCFPLVKHSGERVYEKAKDAIGILGQICIRVADLKNVRD